jgi:colanic acid/amylovoran biosynthesis protein
MKRVLIINSVPSNGGDEALLMATILELKAKNPNLHIDVLCNDPVNAKKHIKFTDLDWDWEYTVKTGTWFKARLRKYLKRILKKYYLNLYNLGLFILGGKDEKRIIKLYKNADYIISSPGGYLNDDYGYSLRVDAFKIALHFNKKLIFLGHSLGPFYNLSDHEDLKKIFSYATHIFLREEYSNIQLKSIGYNTNNVSVTTDIAFCLYNHYRFLFKEKSQQGKKIVVSFRKWDYQENLSFIIQMGLKIILYLIEIGYHVTFLSTCQGLEYYVDDSEIGMEIFNRLDNENKPFFEVEFKKYSVPDLISYYSRFDAYIGMRLHGAILSMLGGTPAFNLGYEDKSKGIYERIGLPLFQVNFRSDLNQIIIPLIDNFLKTNIRINLRSILEKEAALASTNFIIFKW